MSSWRGGGTRRRGPKTSLMLDPLKIAFSQDSISFKFANGTLLSTTITKLTRGTYKLEQFPPIRVFNHNYTWYSLDNRRLYVFKEAAKKGVFYQIPVIDMPASEIRQGEIDAKLTTMNAGRQVTVRGSAKRVHVATRCLYCQRECQTAGHLSLHCQEDHLEEYQEEIRANTQTIAQFLLSKNFVIKDDLNISLDHLKVETANETQLKYCSGSLTQEFMPLCHVRRYDISKLQWRGTVYLDSVGKENMLGVKSNPVIKRVAPTLTFWQETEDITPSETYVTNLFYKVLHFQDEKYPVSL